MPKLSNVMQMALDQQRAADLAPLGLAAAIVSRLAELDTQSEPLARPHHIVERAPCRN